MKLLFDENLSPQLPRLLAAQFPGSVHVRECGLKGQPDEAIWAYARAHGFAIVSKDSDFYQRSLLHGHPPKFIWICIGNCTREKLTTLLAARQTDIAALDAAATESTLVLFPGAPDQP